MQGFCLISKSSLLCLHLLLYCVALSDIQAVYVLKAPGTTRLTQKAPCNMKQNWAFKLFVLNKTIEHAVCSLQFCRYLQYILLPFWQSYFLQLNKVTSLLSTVFSFKHWLGWLRFRNVGKWIPKPRPSPLILSCNFWLGLNHSHHISVWISL